MGNMKCMRKTKIILVPYPAQGHVTPMLKLASVFVDQGFEPVMVTPKFIHDKITPKIDPKDRISCVSIDDGLEDACPGFFSIEKAMEHNMPSQLERLVRELNEDVEVVCVVVDILASWAVEVGRRCGVPVAGFWTGMVATYQLISALPILVETGFISDNGIPQRKGPTRFVSNQPLLRGENLPWIIGTVSDRIVRFNFWKRTMQRCKNLTWILANSFPVESFDDPKQQNLDLLIRKDVNEPTVLPIGPLSRHANIKSPSLWDEDRSCLKWLDKQKPSSVVYISFGSWVVSTNDGIVQSLAMTLEAIYQPFVWVLRSSWKEELPKGFEERVSWKGKVVTWAPQLEILQHKAVGCYLTHCGWNSIMEAIQCQQRLLCFPLAGDQFVNCGYVVEKWKIGVKINGFGEEEIEEGLRRVMQDNEMSDKLERLHERTMGDEASSMVRSNFLAFLHDLIEERM